jgi:hypothetical protein
MIHFRVLGIHCQISLLCLFSIVKLVGLRYIHSPSLENERRIQSRIWKTITS